MILCTEIFMFSYLSFRAERGISNMLFTLAEILRFTQDDKA